MNKEDYFKFLNNKNKDQRLKVIEEYARINNVPIIQIEGIDFLSHIIKIGNVKKILEIGTAIGYSAINFALIADNITVTSIERDELMYKEAINNVNLFNLANRINLLYGDALEVDLSHLDKDYDLLFIDAAKSQYQKFFEKYTSLLRSGGIVVTDNLIFHDLIFNDNIANRNTKQLVNKIKKYNEWLKDNPHYDTHFFNIGDGIAISIKK